MCGEMCGWGKEGDREKEIKVRELYIRKRRRVREEESEKKKKG